MIENQNPITVDGEPVEILEVRVYDERIELSDALNFIAAGGELSDALNSIAAGEAEEIARWESAAPPTESSEVRGETWARYW